MFLHHIMQRYVAYYTCYRKQIFKYSPKGLIIIRITEKKAAKQMEVNWGSNTKIQVKLSIFSELFTVTHLHHILH